LPPDEPLDPPDDDPPDDEPPDDEPPDDEPQKRWPQSGSSGELEHKLGECNWWLVVLAGRMDIDIEQAVESFLAKTEARVGAQPDGQDLACAESAHAIRPT
jgi:hypothetical protein